LVPPLNITQPFHCPTTLAHPDLARPPAHRRVFVQGGAFILFFIWVRWTLPRFRYDQLMRLGWLIFFELALAKRHSDGGAPHVVPHLI